MKAVIVLSGGQDSATSLALAVKRYGAKEVAAITFTYSQRHAIEVEYARKLAKRFGVENHNFVSLDFYSLSLPLSWFYSLFLFVLLLIFMVLLLVLLLVYS